VQYPDGAHISVEGTHGIDRLDIQNVDPNTFAPLDCALLKRHWGLLRSKITTLHVKVTKSGENGDRPARDFVDGALFDRGEPSRKSVQGLTPKAILYALLVFWDSPSLEVALRCVPSNCKRDSFQVIPPGGGGGGRNTPQQLVTGMMSAANLLAYKESEESKKYYESHAALADSQAQLAAIEKRKMAAEASTAEMEEKRQKLNIYNEEIKQLKKEAADLPLSQEDASYLEDLIRKRCEVRASLLAAQTTA